VESSAVDLGFNVRSGIGNQTIYEQNLRSDLGNYGVLLVWRRQRKLIKSAILANRSAHKLPFVAIAYTHIFAW
jgi:hypothetical protein